MARKPQPRTAKTAKAATPSARRTPARATATATTRPARAPKPAIKRSASARPMFDKVAFTLFEVHDARRARAFYEDVLGLTRGLASPDGTWTEYDLPGGGCLALFRHPSPTHKPTPGGAGIAFEVADLDALNDRLVAAGVTYLGPIVRGPHCRMSHIRDSEGNLVILHQLDRK